MWQSFESSLFNIKMSLGSGASLPRDKELTQPMSGYCLVWGYLSVSSSLYAPLFCLRLYVNGPQAGPWILVFQTPSTAALEGCMQANKQLPCASCQERPSGHGRLMPTIEADLAMSLLYVSKAWFHPVLDCVVFTSVTPIPRCNGQEFLESTPGISKCAQGFASLRLVTGAWYSVRQNARLAFGRR